MDNRYILEQTSVGTRVGGADFNYRPGRSVLCDTRVPTAEKNGPMPVYTHGPVFYKLLMDGGSVSGVKGERTSPKGNGRILHEVEKTGLGEQKDTGSSGILKRASPTHCPGTNGQSPGVFMHLDIRNPGKQAELANNFRAAQEWIIPPSEIQPLPSSHIPVPRNRKPSGHADKEVMAATVLTSLSTSPLCSTLPLLHQSQSQAAGLGRRANFPLLTPGDDVNEDVPESTHFMFEDPIPRKRKNSMKVMFKCLWKNCEKVLSTSSGIQRHVRTVHLGRNTDSDYSDGEEDFYYSEIEINMDSLTEGLSSLTPTSPTTCGPPPVFPPPLTAVPHSERINMNSSHCPTPTLLSQSAPSTLCHIRTDHAYQATAPVRIPLGPELAGLGNGNGTRPGHGNGISVSWQSPHVLFKGVLGPVIQVRTVSIGEKRQPAAITHSTVIKNHALVTPAPKSAPGTRKPRGEAKKCRKVYGMEKRDMWCTACRWKKACQRFTD
ncbi:hypothetical protein KUCAC02_012120 [Chaenocephalus aceratus]|uniref:Uncharacterized protein n=1 Tax=Chaenocephalus aceratus TaxID=36190 RepID=A0ACB9XAX9_CHAAC|nr:hypothetical protein KUCAC02_012120 [Chaenocephalus aceratus]